MVTYICLITSFFRATYFYLKHKILRDEFLIENYGVYPITTLAISLSLVYFVSIMLNIISNFIAFFFLVRHSFNNLIEKKPKEKEFRIESFIRINTKETNLAVESFIQK